MTRRRKPVLWCRPLIGSQRHDVLVGNRDNLPDHLEGNDEAACTFEATTIAIRDDLSDERKEDCLAHESFVHALLDATGLKTTFREFLKLTEKQWDDFEEKCLARQYAPALIAMLKANGWLRLPPLPRRARTSACGKAPAKKKRGSRR